MSFDSFNSPADATPSAPVSPQTPAATPVAQPTTPVASAPPATPATPSEDRSNWVPPHRLREQSSKFEQTLQAERARYAAETEALQKKLQILAGVTPPENPQLDQVKTQFKTVFPDLHGLGEQAAAIKELLAIKDELIAAKDQQWTVYNRSAMDRLYKAAEGTYGTPLSEDAKRSLGMSFIGYLQNDPEAYARYQQDPSIVEEYWKAFSDRFVDPVRRSAMVNTAGRIPQGLPLDTPSGAIAPMGGQVKPQTEDERMAQALSVYKSVSKTGFGS